ncbi:OmpA family protein [Shewanella pealeana]|uniref:OmpA/MotB domain protein n=1 Tax=Shewanella pealeana (strain ATCC 700345 / ANG-SQ1) TaxID=398579 RepID=A8H1M9_SHEPA|nr:OmpA family protein [Shewanella pealeana]ABV86466.1 OmpA/MotB domain protein [Shewanella pealeana ATCC 700345]
MIAKLALLLIVSTLLSTPLVTKQWQDSDLDGVPDLKDACAATPPNRVVDAKGCDKALLNKRGPMLSILPDLCLRTSDGKRYPAACSKLSSISVKFGFAQADILPSQEQTIEVIARWLKSTRVSIQLVGHTDSIGDASFNLQLSLKRAEQVKKVFVEQFGFAADRFQINGVGSSLPVANNQTAFGREQNRRVEFLVIVQ